MAIKACLNGGRSREEHPAVPRTPSELAADAIAVRRAGAFAVHVHPRDADGAQTLDAAACDAAVAAIRAAVPGLPVGLSTSEAIDRDPFARAAALTAWRRPPDFVSVNLSELGWAGIARAALHAGIGVEAGLATPADPKSSRAARSPTGSCGRSSKSTMAWSRPAPSRDSSPTACHNCGTATASAPGR
jgi:uncharacterized protein (DUF849 family)